MKDKGLKEELSLQATAVGSLPHSDCKEALDLIFKEFPQFPFWPQLSNCNKNDNMILQFLGSIPGVVYCKSKEKWIFDTHGDAFYEDLENFFINYERIIDGDTDLLEQYGITDEFSIAKKDFLSRIAIQKPKFIKAQVTGPFTWGTMLVDNDGKYAFYDATLREIIVKALSLKALWIIKKIKEASPSSTPVIFLDEPSMSQYGTSAFITVKREDIVGALSEVTGVLKNNETIVGIHCCGKTDWSMIIDSSVDVVNLDGFYFGESLALYAKQVKKFLQDGGLIAWGMVPTLNEALLESVTLEKLMQVFETAKSHLITKEVDEGLIMKHSFITPSCGAGSLDTRLSEKAMTLTAQLAKALSEKYKENIK